MKVTLTTDRLILRPFEFTDAEDMFKGWASDPEVTKYLMWNTHTSIDETRSVLDMWIAEYDRPERLNFAIVLKDSGVLIGGIDVVGYVDGVPEIGYNLSRQYWGKGYMTEACKALISYLFSAEHKTVTIAAMTDNIGSNRVIQKCGGVLADTEESVRAMKGDTVTVNRYYIKAP